jgi:GT2 family glycosyltransferase
VTPPASVSVVVLSYDRPHLLREALASVVSQDCSADLDVTVVDNRSPASADVATLVAAVTGVRLIASRENLGFTGGMNLGLRAARGEYVLLTEDDVVLDPGCLRALLERVATHPGDGLTTAVMLDHNDGRVRCAGGRFDLGAVFRMEIFGAGETDGGKWRKPVRVGYVPGAFLFARRDFLLEVGGFRDDFFLYFEDVELCCRVARFGRPIVVVPAARVRHFDPPARPASLTVEYHKAKNFAATYFLHAPGRVLPAFVVRYGLWGLARLLLTDRRRFAVTLAAWATVLGRLPRLLHDRRTLSAQARRRALP